MANRHPVHPTRDEQEELSGPVSKVRAVVYRQTHNRIWLLCDKNQTGGAMRDADIAGPSQVGIATLEPVRRRCVAEGFSTAPERKEQLNRRLRKLDGEREAYLTVLACSQPPDGRAG